MHLQPGARDPLKLDSYLSTENGRSLSLDDSNSEEVPRSLIKNIARLLGLKGNERPT